MRVGSTGTVGRPGTTDGCVATRRRQLESVSPRRRRARRLASSAVVSGRFMAAVSRRGDDVGGPASWCGGDPEASEGHRRCTSRDAHRREKVETPSGTLRSTETDRAACRPPPPARCRGGCTDGHRSVRLPVDQPGAALHPGGPLCGACMPVAVRAFVACALSCPWVAAADVAGPMAGPVAPDPWKITGRLGAYIANVGTTNADTSRDTTIATTSESTSYLFTYEGQVNWKSRHDSIDNLLKARYGRIRTDGQGWQENNDEVR